MVRERELEIKKKYKLKEVRIEGIKHGYLSPYDVPLRAMLKYDENKQLLYIEFVYLTPNEPTEVQESGEEGIRFRVGSISGKLYKVEIYCPSKECLPDSISVKITSTLDKLIEESERKPKSPVQHENLSMTREFLSKEPELKDAIEELTTT